MSTQTPPDTPLLFPRTRCRYGVAPGSIVLASSLGRAGVAPPGASSETDLTADVKDGKVLDGANDAVAAEQATEGGGVEGDGTAVEPAGGALKRDPEVEAEEPTELSPSMKRIKLENAAADAAPP